MHVLLIIHLAIGLYSALVLAGITWLDHKKVLTGPKIGRTESYVGMVLLVILWEPLMLWAFIHTLRQGQTEPDPLPPAAIVNGIHQN